MRSDGFEANDTITIEVKMLVTDERNPKNSKVLATSYYKNGAFICRDELNYSRGKGYNCFCTVVTGQAKLKLLAVPKN